MFLENGGIPLENAVLSNWNEAVSVVAQLCFSLALAERLLLFEHRDLHWGNVLVRQEDSEFIAYPLNNGTTRLVESHGIKVTIIDYTFSRLRTQGKIVYRPYDDPEYFQGTGDYQFDIYRKMRDAVQDDWSLFCPKTNILWLHYILSKILDGMVKEPKRSKNKDRGKDRLEALFAQILNYNSCEELLTDPFF
jgi:serine/threonine-protein kinase haspin